MYSPGVSPKLFRNERRKAEYSGNPASSAADVIEMMLAGAAAVEVGAANLTDPFACKKIIDGLPAEMDKYGIERLSDIIGGGHAWEKT